MKEYRDLFLAESAKHLSRIEELLEGRDPAPGGGLVEALFREFHSYKGMAGTMRYESMASFAHRVEDMLDALRPSGVLGDVELTTLYRCLDKLSAMREDVSEGGKGALDWGGVFPETSQKSAVPALPGDAARKGGEDHAGDAPPEPGDGKPLKAVITIDPDCPTPAARAYLIVSRFREHFPNLTSEPPLERLLGGARTDSVKLVLPGATKAEVEDVYKSLTEVSALVFEGELSRSPASPPPYQVADPKNLLPEAVEVTSAALDGMVDMVGELTLMSARIRRLSSVLESEQLREEARKLESLVRTMDDSVMAMRCFPFSTVAGRLRRFVRDQGEKQGRPVRLSVSGGQIGVDKAVMIRLSGPLIHLLRNALDHGIESAAERAAAGKSEEGLIEISLERARNMLKLTIEDDGRGIDPVAVGEAAIKKGLATKAEIGTLGGAALHRFLFMPGFSTRLEVGELSGRGVGLDAVANEIGAMGGEIKVASEVGRGTRFELELPVSPSIAPALTLLSGGFTLALPVHAVAGAFEIARDELTQREDGLFVERGGESIPVSYLSDLIGSDSRPDPKRLAMVVVFRGGRKLCLATDRLVREEYLFVKPFKGLWAGLAGLAGYSITGDGGIVYLLDPSGLCGG